MACQVTVQDVLHKRTLAAARDSGYADEFTKRELDIHLAQVVLGGLADYYLSAAAGPACRLGF